MLLGSRVEARYVIEGQLLTTIAITRDQVRVTFEEPDLVHSPWLVDTLVFENGGSVMADAPPDGYSATLSSGCSPDD